MTDMQRIHETYRSSPGNLTANGLRDREQRDVATFRQAIANLVSTRLEIARREHHAPDEKAEYLRIAEMLMEGL